MLASMLHPSLIWQGLCMVSPGRYCGPVCSATKDRVALPSFGAFSVSLPTEDDVPELTSLLLECFHPSSHLGEVPPLDSDEVPPLDSHERWTVVSKGLRWRLGSRLDHPSLDASMETSLMLVLTDETESLLACAELSLRPMDGKLPGEFCVPPLFLLARAEDLGAYLSNVAVRRSHRRRGLATALLRACEDLVCTQWGLPALYLHVDLFNQAAATLYRTCGYEMLPSYDAVCQPPSSPVGSGQAALSAPVTVHNRYHRKVLSSRRHDGPRVRPAVAG